MGSELGRWYAVMESGSKVQSRSRPRSETTIRVTTRWIMPALRSWAAAGHASLRETTADSAVLPPSGDPRATMGQGLRSLFRILKAHRVVFLNPLHRIRTAFYGLRSGQLRSLFLTDLYSGCLHVDARTIPLAAPVRKPIQAWLRHREQHWPQTPNTHLFISRSTAREGGPVGVEWITETLGTTAWKGRKDRTLHELIASGGDLRLICDMFGLSIAGAKRQAAVPRPLRPGLALMAAALLIPPPGAQRMHGHMQAQVGRTVEPGPRFRMSVWIIARCLVGDHGYPHMR